MERMRFGAKCSFWKSLKQKLSRQFCWYGCEKVEDGLRDGLKLRMDKRRFDVEGWKAG